MAVEYKGLIGETAKQMIEFTDLYRFENGLEWFIENAKCPGCQKDDRPGVR